MSEYGTICLNNAEYALVCLNAPQYFWTWLMLLNVPEYSWSCLNKLQKQPPEVFYQKGCSYEFRNFIKKEALGLQLY